MDTSGVGEHAPPHISHDRPNVQVEGVAFGVTVLGQYVSEFMDGSCLHILETVRLLPDVVEAVQLDRAS
jgi:hypothetical protein